ncbi:hypothetical protein [Streptomyces sp. TE33382]
MVTPEAHRFRGRVTVLGGSSSYVTQWRRTHSTLLGALELTCDSTARRPVTDAIDLLQGLSGQRPKARGQSLRSEGYEAKGWSV